LLLINTLYLYLIIVKSFIAYFSLIFIIFYRSSFLCPCIIPPYQLL